MKKQLFFFIFLTALCFVSSELMAQCSMCTKTASQLGEKPALGMNQGILYLMGAPFAIMGYIGYRWWKGQKATEAES
ncbi:MAG: hypothetical protein EOO06_18330 [Chitinophagaceae bacterium]|nr:MAG: hypothetical protein EOO06_18330 [Chitinophagaceae bacterium]